MGTNLMPWQRHVADVALEVEPSTGRLRYRRVVLTVPRQSGKTTLMLATFLHRSLGMGSAQISAYAAQNGLDARVRLQREWHKLSLQGSPALRDTYVPSWTTGAEALLFHNGSRLQVVAGTEKSGHGQTLDLAMVDEAFAQRDGRLEQALSPAMMTRPEPQLWYISTAGSPTDTWFRDKVDRGRELVDGNDGVAFFEWSAPADADPTDRDAWWSCMPALGHTVTEAVVAAECLGMPSDEFRRAYLNQWVDRGAEGVFDNAWPALADPAAARGSQVSFGVSVAPDRSWSAVAVAWRRPDGRVQVMLADYRASTEWVAARVSELRSSWGGSVIASTTARGLVVGAVEPSQAEQALAHTGLDDAVRAGSVRHGNEPALNVAVRGAQWRAYGDTRMFDRKGSLDISPLDAAALAVRAVNSGDDLPPNIW